MREKLEQEFKELFGDEGKIRTYFAPGRVNLIGEHTDYNGGHVFPCALTMGTYLVVRKREDRFLNFYSMNFEDVGIISTSLDELNLVEKEFWVKYPKGVIWQLAQEGKILEQGFDVVYYGDIPNSYGLSSSASIEVATLYMINDLYKLNLTNKEIALISQKAENNFVGVKCGIMDQFAIANGKKDNAIFLDTATLEYESAPIVLEDAKIVIMNTNKKRGLADSKYNERRAECEEALRLLQTKLDIKSLGDLTIEEFEKNSDLITDEIIKKRAKHAVYENQRTIKAVQALKDNNIEEFGTLMIQSHISLRDDYEVTGIELDTLVDIALKQDGVIGARMTGAGFGGCAVSIVKNDYINDFIEKVGYGYEKIIGYKADFYVVEIGDGPRKL